VALSKGAMIWAAGIGACCAAAATPLAWRALRSANVSPVASAPAAPPTQPSTVAAVVPAPPRTEAAPAAAPPMRPAFDVVRVEPTGEAVIAGHAAPGAKIALTDSGAVVAEAVADASGQFAMLPPTLAPGGHRLELDSAASGARSAARSEPVTIDVPVAKTAPSPPAAASPPTAAKAAPPVVAAKAVEPAAAVGSSRVSVRAVEVAEAGRLGVTGGAAASAFIRLYLNGSFLANAVAGPDGTWSLTVERGMKPGSYAIRADSVDRASGAVISRAEVPFIYPDRPSHVPARLASIAPGAGMTAVAPAVGGLTAAPQTAPHAPAPTIAASRLASTQVASASTAGAAAVGASDAVIAEIKTAKVIRGDSLWRISWHLLGDGQRYRQIFAANASQIRDPRLIYPGQILVVPKTSP
jgi:nucleoid-associated protein YgaU